MKIDTVFLHGWAMNSAVWRHCLQAAPDRINPLCVDLPGYGEHRQTGAVTLDQYAEAVAQSLRRPSVLVGWSLGGLVSMAVALRFPDKVLGLVQVATSPRFVQAGDWQTAIDQSVFDQFAASLQKDVGKTIKRFLALQVRATSHSASTVRALQRSIDERGLPSNQALIAGLKILSETDLRAALPKVACPVTWVLGEKDMLVPVTLADVLRDRLPGADIRVAAGAGHAPFLSDPVAFLKTLEAAVGRS